MSDDGRWDTRLQRPRSKVMRDRAYIDYLGTQSQDTYIAISRVRGLAQNMNQRRLIHNEFERC